MLVMSRKEGEAIVFPREAIEVRVLRIDQGRIRLGITAPDERRVYREEVLERHPELLDGKEGDHGDA